MATLRSGRRAALSVLGLGTLACADLIGLKAPSPSDDGEGGEGGMGGHDGDGGEPSGAGGADGDGGSSASGGAESSGGDGGDGGQPGDGGSDSGGTTGDGGASSGGGGAGDGGAPGDGGSTSGGGSGSGGDSGDPECSMVAAEDQNTLHQHQLFIAPADVAAGMQKMYSTTIGGNPDHDHVVTLTSADFAELSATGSVTVVTEATGGHTHDFVIACSE